MSQQYTPAEIDWLRKECPELFKADADEDDERRKAEAERVTRALFDLGVRRAALGPKYKGDPGLAELIRDFEQVFDHYCIPSVEYEAKWGDKPVVGRITTFKKVLALLKRLHGTELQQQTPSLDGLGDFSDGELEDMWDGMGPNPNMATAIRRFMERLLNTGRVGPTYQMARARGARPWDTSKEFLENIEAILRLQQPLLSEEIVKLMQVARAGHDVMTQQHGAGNDTNYSPCVICEGACCTIENCDKPFHNTSCQLSDGSWTCSRDCWEAAAEDGKETHERGAK